MKRFLTRIISEADAVLALAIAVSVGVSGFFDAAFPPRLATNAILVVLGVLALAILRDRWRRDVDEQGDRERFGIVVNRFDAATADLARVADLARIFPEAVRALDQTSVIKLVHGGDVRRAHELARANTDRWTFRGGTGTYLRAVTLPECVRLAREQRRTLMLRAEILDPLDLELCERYASFRQSLNSGPDATGEVWTTRRTREESFATILAACWYRDAYRLLDVRIALTERFSVFRYDMSSTSLIVTQDDAKLPTLLIPVGTFLYDSYETELRASFEQARPVPLDKTAHVTLTAEPSVTQVRTIFDLLDIPFPLTDDEARRVIRKATHAKNPYQ